MENSKNKLFTYIGIWLVYFFSYQILMWFLSHLSHLGLFNGWFQYMDYHSDFAPFDRVDHEQFRGWEARRHAFLISTLATLTTRGFLSKKPEESYFVNAFSTQIIVWAVLFVWGVLCSTLLYWVIGSSLYHNIPDQFGDLIFQGIGWNVIISFVTYFTRSSD